MAFKINVNGFGKTPSLTSTDEKKEISVETPVTEEVDDQPKEEKQEFHVNKVLRPIKKIKKEEESVEEESNAGFVLGEDFEKTEHVEKKAFEGHNKDVLFAKNEQSDDIPNDINALPDLNIDIASDATLDTEQAKQKIIEREEKKVQYNIDHEIQKERNNNLIGLAPTVNHLQAQPEVIKVVCIGGNEQFYKTTLAKLNLQYPNIEFIKHISVGGKNAFYTIDTMNPDIILIHHKSNLQDALQFYDSIQNDMDESGVYYREKYKYKRVVVISPQDDFSYDMQLRNKGIEFSIKELNARTRMVETKELVHVINQAYADIKAQKLREQKMEQEALERQRKAEQEALMQSMPEINVQPEEPSVQQEEMPTIASVVEEKAPVAPQQPVFQNQVYSNPTATNQLGLGEHKIIGVYSAAGGAGKTMFATNLSSILAKYSNSDNQNNYKVCLVEYNLVCQNVDLFFNIKSEKNLGLLAQEVSSKYLNEETGRVEIEPAELRPLLSQYIYKEPNTNLDILLGITVPMEIDRIKKGFSKCLFKTLKDMYDVVIIDMSSDIAKTPILETFNEADYIYYIMPMDVASIRNTKKLFQFLTGLFRFPPENIKVIINKADNDNEEFDIKQVYEALADANCIPEGTIPYDDKSVLSSINRGVPLALEQMDNLVVKSIYSIASGINPMLSSEVMLEEDAPKNESGGFLGKLFGGSKEKKKVNVSNKKQKNSIFSKKKEHPMEEEEVKQPPKKKSLFGGKKNKEVVEEKPKKKGLFGNKKKKEEELPELPALPDIEIQSEEVDEKPKKKGLLSRFFGGGDKKKKEATPKIKNKKKSFGGLLGKGKGKVDEVEETTNEESATPNKRPSRLLSSRPMRRN